VTESDSTGLADLGAVHVVGIGGAGMSGIARILIARGVGVSGSDAKDSRRVSALRALGADVFIGHAVENVGDADTVIISTAIPESNAELRYARESGLRVMSRAEALAAIMAGSKAVAVSGTHGKTTTTSMLTVALQHCGADPSFVIGSELNESGSNAHTGSGELFIAEADESDGSFLQLNAFAGIVTNVEADHLDYWGTLAAVEEGFDTFLAGIASQGGFAVVCIDDPGGAQLAQRALTASIDVRTYGVSPLALNRIEVSPVRPGTPASFTVLVNGIRSPEITLQVPGQHNILNATAALVCGLGLGFPIGELADGLASFSGTRRRFEFRGSADGVRVYDDYAHHPTEIAATLNAARGIVGEGKLVVAFQAHHYYRTALFSKEFGEALGLADEVVVLEVFAPGEDPIPGASGQVMASNVPLAPEHVVFEPSWSAVPRHLASRAESGDIVMTLGAGDISMMGPEVMALLEARERAMAPESSGTST
jgi:UDP-N-acetylmuramate--alanine ligase